VNTKSLFDLPKDVIEVPILKDLLTEDFVFYYRDGGADWMSFRGTLARLAFEQQTDWPTKVMKWILNGPAEVAFWKGPDGKLTNFIAVIDQSGVKEISKLIAESAIPAGESQMKIDATTGSKISTLTLATGRTVYMTTEENRLFIFTNAAIPVPLAAKNRSYLDRAKAFFGANEDVSLFGPKLGSAKHVVTVSARYLSFGYQAFFSGIKGVRFDFAKASGWTTKLLTTNAAKPADEKDWAQMPKGAAFCLAVPVDTKAVGAVVKAETWLQKSAGSAVACWYPESKLHSPLIATRGDFTELLKKPDELKRIFTSTIGSREITVVAGPTVGEGATFKYLPVLPVQDAKVAAGQVGFIREVGGRYGFYPSSKSPNNKLLGSKRYFKVKLVATSGSIYFSPDDRLVDKGLTTADGKFPSMATSLPAKGKSASFIVAPDALAKLAKASILESLPESQESIFRTAVSRQLFPNLEKFAKRPLQAASIGSGGNGAWKQVEWTTNAAK
ncbi:MAG: DUF2138 family protein, partial [Bdellovibrionota bacterium]